MSIDDYRKGRDCTVPPKWEFDDWHSSMKEDLPKLGDERVHLLLANPRRSKPFNSSLHRFQPDHWVIDYNAHMVATILPEGERSFRVPVQWRTNQDFLGVRWMSKDTFSHPYFTYQEHSNYLGLILAFQHNPDEPDKFTVTIETPEKAWTYRLSPYVFNEKNRRWENLDKKYGTKKSYQAEIFQAGDFSIPDDQITPAWGRKDYIYILDFGDLRTQQNYTGPIVNPRNIKMVSFDCTEAHHGLGRKAFCSLIKDNGDGTVQVEVGGIHTNANLTEGDTLQIIYRYWNDMGDQLKTEMEFPVVSFTGFGTSNFSVRCKGTLPGTFVAADAFLGKYLKEACPIEQKDADKYFVNMTLSGSGVKTLKKRRYVQPVANLGMTAGFDDGYNLTPERQVQMTYDLGYRDWWTTYIGMSHYWKGMTAYQHKVDGHLVNQTAVLEFPVLMAGQSMISGHFVIGQYPNRGQDEFQKYMTEQWGINYAGVKPINGATGSTASERMCSVNPNSDVWDPDQTGTKGGLWWWDLEADKPGPALLHCIEEVGEDIPKLVIWGQGDQDASALKYPADRVPKPSLARSKEATKKIFAYFRSLWGADLPIYIQEQGYGWGITNVEEPNVPVQIGLPTYLTARRNSWGDLEFRWKSYGMDPEFVQYRVEIYHPVGLEKIIHSFVVPGTQVVDGYVYADWAIEQNVPVMVEAQGDQFEWDYIKYRVVAMYRGNEVKSKPWFDEVKIDDVGLVKKRIICGINSLIGGYFNDLSDPLNHGGSGKPGRKDVIAASTLRKTLAANAGLRDIEVIPVMTVVGSSPINPMTYQPGFDPENYWWNPVTKQPGPNLIIADEIVKSSAKVPDYFIESGPGETTGIAYADKSMWPGIISQWRQSNIEMLTWMRANWGNPNLEIWFQGATTSWWGDPPPQESNTEGAAELRKIQDSMSLEGIGFKMASYVPDANLYQTYYNEMDRGIGWVHYSLDGYHAAAREVGEALAKNINRALNPPDWTKLALPPNLRAVKKANRDIVVTWTPRPGITKWHFMNHQLDNAAVIKEGFVDVPEFRFTLLEQQQAYQSETENLYFGVSEYVEASNTIGPQAMYQKKVITGDYMQAPKNVSARKSLNGDITFSWQGRPEHQSFYVENLDSGNSSKAIFAKPCGTETLVWTLADQLAYYGGTEGANYVAFRVSEYDISEDVTSVSAEYNGTPLPPLNPLNPVKGMAALQLGDKGDSDIKFVWTPSPSAPQRDVQITNVNLGTGNPIFTEVLTGSSRVWTRAEQIAVYGFTALNVTFDAKEHDIANDVYGPNTRWSGEPQRAEQPEQGWARVINVDGDVTMYWDVMDGSEWDAEIVNLENSSIAKSATVTVPQITWTAAEMRAVYGYVVTNMMWRVRPRRPDGASNNKVEFSDTATPL